MKDPNEENVFASKEQVQAELMAGMREELGRHAQHIEGAARAAAVLLATYRPDLVADPEKVYTDPDVRILRETMPAGVNGAMALCSMLAKLLGEGAAYRDAHAIEELERRIEARTTAEEVPDREAEKEQVRRQPWESMEDFSRRIGAYIEEKERQSELRVGQALAEQALAHPGTVQFGRDQEAEYRKAAERKRKEQGDPAPGYRVTQIKVPETPKKVSLYPEMDELL